MSTSFSSMNTKNTTDTKTIGAIATPRGHGGVAIIRLSGPRAWEIVHRLFSRTTSSSDLSDQPSVCFEAGRYYHGWIMDPELMQGLTESVPIDEVLVLPFKAPKSYTGEDVAEIHCHGGELLAQTILSLCLREGAHPAEPGEFTKRAFLNNRMDLTQAESIMDLISARGERLLTLASANLKHKSLGTHIDTMGETLMAVQSQIVASIDFPDEVDEPDRVPLQQTLDALFEKVQGLERAAEKGHCVREGLKIALLGMPNSGKSSIFNQLLAQERSIVTEIAGTTRDMITESLQVSGIPITLIDTAGLHETGDPVEIMGIERSWNAAQEAQAVLYVYDATQGFSVTDQQMVEQLSRQFSGEALQVIANKIDLCNGNASSGAKGYPLEHLMTSAITGGGLGEIFDWMEAMAFQDDSGADEISFSINQRQLACLSRFRDNLQQALEALAHPSTPIDLVTLPITEALHQLDELMGRDTTEEVLDRVFSQFCVGK